MKTESILFLIIFTVFAAVLSGCSKDAESTENTERIGDIAFSETVPLSYAECFSIDRYEGGYSLIKTMNGEKYLLVPKDMDIPNELPNDIIALSYPIEDVYLVAANA
ncbi:MAG: ABC transporter substrate-binding protein, partial [Oscillospiraceae bacterium]|nr:ABC transporter substrate-binding protein [Oscillospiraceae bacterium]